MPTTTNFEIEQLVDAQAQKVPTVNAALASFDRIMGSLFTDTVLDADYTFARSDALGFRYFSLDGTLTADRNVIVPDQHKEYCFQNNTTGGFSLVIKTSAGTGITLAPNPTTYRLLYCDSADVFAVVVT